LGGVSPTVDCFWVNQAKRWWPVGGKGKADLPEAQLPCAALAANSCGPWF
jgi:hypothetical protein